MIVTAFRELVSRRAATILAALGLLTATIGFMLLASTAKTTQAVLTGDISSAWNTPYDILVRPSGHQARLEIEQGLVRPNFLGSMSGGITMEQLAAIRGIVGVDLAAPVAVAGYMTVPANQQIVLAHYATSSPFVAFRVTATRSSDAGMSTYPAQVTYFLAAAQGNLEVQSQSVGSRSERLVAGSQSVDCTRLQILCQGQYGVCPQATCPMDPGSMPVIATTAILQQAVVVAGIDPVAEARLAGLDRCVSNGRYLSESDQWSLQSLPRLGTVKQIPALLSDHTFIDESLTVKVDRALNPTIAGSGDPFGQIKSWTQVLSSSWTADDLYRYYFDVAQKPIVSFSNTWTPGDVTYSANGARLTALTTAPDFSVFQTGLEPNLTGEQLAPPEAKDLWFRSLTAHQINTSYGPGDGPPAFLPVGRYDPSCLEGFNPLAGGQMETYAPASVTLPDGRKLAPNASVTGYVNMPPTILTTLSSVSVLDDPSHYSGAPGSAFISVIRVRVAGTEKPGSVAEARLSRVAAEIHDATGLQVDVVKGSSARQIRIALPAGLFGRPALTVTEPWSAIGVGFRFLQAVSQQNLLIFSLVLIAASILVAQTAYTSVRRRRSEFAVLRAIGWPPWRIAQLVELELLILGAVVGGIGLAVGLVLTQLVHVDRDWWTIIGVVPLAVVISLLAGVVPAAGAMRGTTIDAVVEPEPIRRRRLPSSSLTLGLRQALVWRWDLAMGIAALLLGATMLSTVVLIAAGFRGQLDTTILGTYLAGQVRPFHLVVAGLTLAIGTIAAAQVISLAYLDRRVQLATLRALGWSRFDVVKMLIGQALGIALLSGVLAIVLSIALGLILAAPVLAVAGAAFTAGGMTVIGGVLAVVAPLAHAYAADPAAGLRGE